MREKLLGHTNPPKVEHITNGKLSQQKLEIYKYMCMVYGYMFWRHSRTGQGLLAIAFHFIKCVDSADSVPFPILRFINVTKQFLKVSWNAVAVGCIIKRIANCSLKDISYLFGNATGRMRIIGQP